MSFCEVMKRNCSFTDICKKNYTNLNTKETFLLKKYQEDDITVIQFLLWMRKIMKFEWEQKEIQFNDKEKIEKILDKYLSKYSLWYTSIQLKSQEYWFFIASDSEVSLRDFLHSNYQEDIYKKIVEVGLFMGYPKCCIKNYIHFVKKYWYTSDLDHKLEINSIDNNSSCPLIASKTKWFVHFACSPQCENTLKISERILSWIFEKEWKIFLEDYFS